MLSHKRIYTIFLNLYKMMSQLYKHKQSWDTERTHFDIASAAHSVLFSFFFSEYFILKSIFSSKLCYTLLNDINRLSRGFAYTFHALLHFSSSSNFFFKKKCHFGENIPHRISKYNKRNLSSRRKTAIHSLTYHLNLNSNSRRRKIIA